ncbi:MAG: hypothetical protein AB7K24_05795 [Gemmataceae bacterium]
MRLFRFGMAASVLALLLFSVSLEAQRRREGDLKVGDLAPDFTVTSVDGKETVALAKLKGKPVLLIFGSCT